MVLNTQSYMWMGWVGIGYLLGPTLRAPYGANKKIYKIYYISHLTGGPFSAIDREELDVLVLSFL